MPKKPPEQPLYVRLPAAASNKLDRAATALGVAKKDLVAGLVTKYVDPDSQRGLSELTTLSSHRMIGSPNGAGLTMGSYSFQAYDPPEVMNAEQAGQLLHLEEKVVLELAESGKLPGRKLGNVWRFSRAAVLAWLAAPGTP